MQTKKKDIQKTIIETARKEFYKNGYTKTSMRTIAKKSNVTLSNIYNYFRNKDEILEIIVKPVFDEMEKSFNRHNDPYYLTTSWVEIEDVSEMEDFKYHLKIFNKYQKELHLLLYKCSGSKYENIKEFFIDKYTESAKDYLKLMKNKYPQVNKEISDFFIHTVAAWWIQIISEIVSHNLNEKEILFFFKEYMTFVTGGWQKIMNL